jgi:transcriptional regulator with XRE-family HTH domain
VGSDIRIRFGNRVKELRRKRGLTQVVLAERLGLGRSYVAGIGRGHRKVSLVNIEVIAQGLGVTLRQLFSRL